jgi:hypothetical protein
VLFPDADRHARMAQHFAHRAAQMPPVQPHRLGDQDYPTDRR